MDRDTMIIPRWPISSLPVYYPWLYRSVRSETGFLEETRFPDEEEEGTALSDANVTEVKHLTMAELEAGLAHIRQAPKTEGVLELIVRRPERDRRESLTEGHLDLVEGLAGDTWRTRRDLPNPETQVTLMNARAAALVAQERARWPLAGDQLYLDLDLSSANLPPGTQLAIGSAVVEVSAIPHTGCQKFVARFGLDAMLFVNSAVGRELNLRGINAKVVQPGTIRVGDRVRKL
jgi:MOSC domain-containing protein YiiM